MKGAESMEKQDLVALSHARADLRALEALEELEERLELACTTIDPCLGQYCWQFGSTYGCPSECAVQCQPFGGCDPYCCD